MKTETFLERFHLHRDLGKGSYGKVKLAEDISTGQLYALKFIARESLKKRSQVVRVNREIRILKMLDHPHIIRLYDAVETESDIILVMEYCSGGELFEYVQSKARGLSEGEAKQIFCQILSAVEYCHANRIIHRDLKPENLLLDAKGNVKLIDFGFANVYDPLSHCNTFCGSPFYAAPEVIEGKAYIGPQADIWSLGIILYILVCGKIPFVESEIKNLVAKIKALDYVMPSWISNGAKDLIHKLLVIEPSARMAIEDLKRHFWISEAVKRHFIHHQDVIPTRRPVELIDRMLLTKLERYGFFPKESLVTRILSDPNSPQFACYHLLKERFNRELKVAGNYSPSTWETASSTRILPGQEQHHFPVNAVKSSKISPLTPIGAAANGLRGEENYSAATTTTIPRPPDLEIFIKSDVFVQEMISFLSKLPHISSLVMSSSEKYKWFCQAVGVSFSVQVLFAEGNWFSTSANSHASVYIERAEGDVFAFLQLRQAIIKHFI